MSKVLNERFPNRIAFTSREFGQLTGMAPATISRNLRDGVIPSFLIGGKRMISRDYIESLGA